MVTTWKQGCGLDIGGGDAGARGMSISSGSSGASGKGASYSSSDASAMAHSTGSSGAGSGSIRLASNSPIAEFCVSVAEFCVSVGAQATPPRRTQLGFCRRRP